MCLAQGHNAVMQVRLQPAALDLESSSLPLRHCAPYASAETDELHTLTWKPDRDLAYVNISFV